MPTRKSHECALCTAETDQGGPWLELGHVCASCRSGQVAPVVERWGLELSDAPLDPELPRDRGVRVRRPTRVAGAARLSLEHLSHKAIKRLGRRDPEVGDERFDDQIWVEADEGALNTLRQPGVRAAVIELLQIPAVTTVELDEVGVTVRLHASADLADRLVDEVLVMPLQLARHLAVALAAQLERRAVELETACSEPGGDEAD